MVESKPKSFFKRVGTAWNFVFPDKTPDESIIIKRGKGNGSPQAFYPTQGRVIYAGPFDGEKSYGEIGPIKNYLMNYPALTMRAWQAWVESAEAQTILNKFATWVVGVGLKLQAEPKKELVGDIDLKKFSTMVEARWDIYSNSLKSDYKELETLNQSARTCYKNATIGGDCLVIVRMEEVINVQLVDSNHLQSPLGGSEWWPMVNKAGNRIINGIEIDKRGRHVAYYVRKPFDNVNPLSNPFEFDRVPAIGRKNGILGAFLVYGLKYRIDTQRGIPLLTAVLEKLKKLDRYEEATLGSAEEQAKIAYQIIHTLGSTGEFPFSASIAAAHDIDSPINSSLATRDSDNAELTNKVIATTGKQVVNNPINAEIKPLRDTKTQLYFKDFRDKVVEIIAASAEMPPDVAMSLYNSNYSASRAAIKDWEHTLKVKRMDFAIQFYQKIYNIFLQAEILDSNIFAPGYLTAFLNDDFMMIEAFRKARWIGAPVPNIDPMKEVQAEREKLGITGESIPLTTVEAATEALGSGDSEHNMLQYADELETSKTLGIKPEPEVKQTSVVTDK